MTPVIRLQWMRNKEAGQEFGNQEEILPLTEPMFRKFVLPNLRRGYARSLEEYQDRHPIVTHYSMLRVGGRGPWRFNGIGSAVLLIGNENARKFTAMVESWDSPEALEWGRTADSDVHGLEARE